MQLVIKQGARAGQVFPLTGRVADIGRAVENDLVLPDQGVSRRHARVQRSDEGWVLTDLGSTNGTLVNHRQLGGGHLLRPGDRVQVGSAVLLAQEEPGDGVPQRPFQAERQSSARRHPAVMIVAALLLVILMVGLVVLLVTILRPEEAPPTATPANSIEQMMTSLPVPTEVQDVMTAIVPLISTALPLPPAGATPVPSPPSGGRVVPAGKQAVGGSFPLAEAHGQVCAEVLVARSRSPALSRSANP